MSLLTTNIPTLEMHPVKTPSSNYEGGIISLNQLLTSIYDALTQYPYYVIINGFAPLQEHTELSQIIKSPVRDFIYWKSLMSLAYAIRAKISPESRTNHEDIDKVSFTKICISRQVGEAQEDGVTQYSRTHLPLPPHTDSSYMVLPHEIVAFHCVEADENGGETIMVPIDHILKHLDKSVLARLRDPVYPFGQGYHGILCGDEDNPLIRYYHAQVKRSLTSDMPPLPQEHQSALRALDDFLDQNHRFQKFRLKPGQILFMHNHKVLHGRTALSPDTNRLLYRLRMHVASLGSEGQMVTSSFTDVCK